jgi:CDGSH-type Zn-finger protein
MESNNAIIIELTPNTKIEICCSLYSPNKDAEKVVDGNVFAAMCRCGASANKPQCDGTHRKINFKAEEKTLKVV